MRGGGFSRRFHTNRFTPATVGAPFLTLLERRARYYAVELRFADARFWMRRHGIDWEGAPITLDPRWILRWHGVEPDPAAIAPVEKLLPPRAIRSLLDRLRRPAPPHEALGALRDAAPLGDRRVLVGLQMLVEGGFVAAE